MAASVRVFLVVAFVASCSRTEPRPEARDSAAPSSPAAARATEPSASRAASPAPAAASGVTPAPDAGTGATMMKSLSVSSPAFTAGGAIPAKYTCEGENLSPPLAIDGVPDGTKSLALVVEDPDAPDPAAPKTVWAHWVLYDLPPSTRSLAVGAGNHGKLGKQGKNDWGATGYRGPCPPVGRHRYFIRVFALDKELGELHEPSKASLLGASQGHVLARGELFGTYQKTK